MDKESIFAVVKANVLRVLGDVDESEIAAHKSLVDLGANSVDRVEVAMYTMEQLDLKIPRMELSEARNIQGLVDILYKHCNGAQQIR